MIPCLVLNLQVGVVAWRMTLITPEYPEGREVENVSKFEYKMVFVVYLYFLSYLTFF
jgi:hypothetical protein